MDTQIQDLSYFGTATAHWRRLRGLSQERLGTAIGHSQRHISFVETGRVKPSRATVERLVEALSIPPRDGNRLLRLLGYTESLSESDPKWSAVDPSLDAFRRMIVSGLEPFPACVVDNRHCVILTNLPYAVWLTRIVLSQMDRPQEVFHDGFLHFPLLLFHEQGIRPHMSKWESFARGYVQAVLRLRMRHPQFAGQILTGIQKTCRLPDDWLRMTDNLETPADMVVRADTIVGPVNVRYIPFVVTNPDNQCNSIFPEFSIDLYRPADALSEHSIRQLAQTLRPEDVHPLLQSTLAC